MGFQAVHYLNVYEENEAKAYNGYLKSMGLKGVDYEELEEVMEKYDSHGNNAQTKAFIKLLKKEYGIDPGQCRTLS